MLKFDFYDFNKLWDNKLKKLLFRCSKECGIYNEIKAYLYSFNGMKMNTTICHIYDTLYTSLNEHNKRMIKFDCVERQYSAKKAINNITYFAHFFLYAIVSSSNIKRSYQDKLFIIIDKELFRKNKFERFILNKWKYIKLFFNY